MKYTRKDGYSELEKDGVVWPIEHGAAIELAHAILTAEQAEQWPDAPTQEEVTADMGGDTYRREREL